MFKKLFKKINPRYLLVYRKEDGKVKTYEIGRPMLEKSVSNKKESRNNVGFKSYCFARSSIRSFRHDRIVSITKL
jgi:hypothetical protein